MFTGTFPIAYFGKIPAHGDFIRYQAGGNALRALDTWLQQGLHFASSQLNQQFDAAYSAMGTCAFYFTPRDAEHVYVGVLQPSHDSVGRTYPFLIMQEVDGAAFDAHRIAHVPLRFNPFLEGAAALARDAAAGQVGRETLTSRTEELNGQVDDEKGVAFFGRYLQQTTVTSFWERLWGYAQDSRKYLLFKNLFDILLPLRNGIPAGYPLVLRFPLCPDAKTIDYDVSFWLGLCLRLLKYPEVQPSFFWTYPDAGQETPPFLLLALYPPASKTFSYLLSAGIDGDTLCELEKIGAENAALAALSIPDQYGRMLEDEQLTLWDFLTQL